MRIIWAETISLYEAFLPHGFEDAYGWGDDRSPLAPVVLDQARSLLWDMGYEVESGAGPYGDYIARLWRRQDGAAYDLAQLAEKAGIDLEEGGPEAARQALIAGGLQDVVEAFDRRDVEACELPLLSYVIVRHPNSGDIIDVHACPTPQEAARLALRLQEEGEDVEVCAPNNEEGGARYRQLLYDEELAELAGEP